MVINRLLLMLFVLSVFYGCNAAHVGGMLGIVKTPNPEGVPMYEVDFDIDVNKYVFKDSARAKRRLFNTLKNYISYAEPEESLKADFRNLFNLSSDGQTFQLLKKFKLVFDGSEVFYFNSNKYQANRAYSDDNKLIEILLSKKLLGDRIYAGDFFVELKLNKGYAISLTGLVQRNGVLELPLVLKNSINSSDIEVKFDVNVARSIFVKEAHPRQVMPMHYKWYKVAVDIDRAIKDDFLPFFTLTDDNDFEIIREFKLKHPQSETFFFENVRYQANKTYTDDNQLLAKILESKIKGKKSFDGAWLVEIKLNKGRVISLQNIKQKNGVLELVVIDKDSIEDIKPEYAVQTQEESQLQNVPVVEPIATPEVNTEESKPQIVEEQEPVKAFVADTGTILTAENDTEYIILTFKKSDSENNELVGSVYSRVVKKKFITLGIETQYIDQIADELSRYGFFTKITKDAPVGNFKIIRMEGTMPFSSRIKKDADKENFIVKFKIRQ